MRFVLWLRKTADPDEEQWGQQSRFTACSSFRAAPVDTQDLDARETTYIDLTNAQSGRSQTGESQVSAMEIELQGV